MYVDWDAVSAVGTWLGAIATFAAVVVALRESAKAYKPRVSATATSLVYNSSVGMKNEIVSIIITNVGACRASIKGIVVRKPGKRPIEVGIDQGYADCHSFRTLEGGEQIERDWPVSYFNMEMSGLKKKRLSGFVRKIVGRPYRMTVIDTSGREFRVKMHDSLQNCLEAAQR